MPLSNCRAQTGQQPQEKWPQAKEALENGNKDHPPQNRLPKGAKIEVDFGDWDATRPKAVKKGSVNEGVGQEVLQERLFIEEVRASQSTTEL